MGGQMKLLNMIEIHNRISMHTKKTTGIKQRLKIFHALPRQIGRFRQMKPNVIPG